MSRRRSRVVGASVRYVLISLWLLFALLPVYAAVVASLTRAEDFGENFLYPKTPYLQNYVDVFERIPILDFLRASLVYSLGTSILCVVLASSTAYALARFRFLGSRALQTTILLTQLVPQAVVIVPTFMILNSVGLYDTYLGVILLVTATGVALPIFLMRGFIEGLPISLEEAARLDGASRLQILRHVVLPLAAPGVATAFGLSFFMGWGQYLYPLVLTRSPEHVPVTVGVGRMVDNSPPWDMIMTGTVISVLPPVIIYLAVQKFLLRDMTGGAVK